MGGARVRIRLAGPLAVEADDGELAPTRLGSRRARLLLGYLAVERRRTIGVAELVAVLWPDGVPQRPEAGVATLVSRLRSQLGRDAIRGSRAGYQLGHRPAVEVDLDEAAALIGEAERRALAEPGPAASAASRALDLLGSGVLDDEPTAEWVEPARVERIDLIRRARHAGAQAALGTGDAAGALRLAREAIAADAFDEQAYRDLMAAHQATGTRAEALTGYDRLRRLLADELGIDPSQQTRELHAAILREERHGRLPEPVRSHAPSGLAGRDREFAALAADWASAAAGQPAAVLVLGEAGIGKTRLTEEIVALAERTGATILRARCYEAERSLFLQPITDALTSVLARLPTAVVAELAGRDAGLLGAVLPSVITAPAPTGAPGGTAEFRRRRTFEALTGLIGRLAVRAPVVLLVDDLHSAGRSTLEFVHFLIRHDAASRLLLLATARSEESAAVRSTLYGLADVVELGPLPRAAVAALAEASGYSGLTDSIMARTSGHTLYVVEVLRELSTGSGDVPTSLAAVVLERVHRLGAPVAMLLRAAAVLGPTFDPALLAALVDVTPQAATEGCEQALAARLLTVAGAEYVFVHALVREVLYADLPEPTRVGYHRRAADLLTERPEAMAEHAVATQDWERAARAWLAAAEAGLGRLAVSDAESLATRALEAAERIGDRALQARALMLRGRIREMTTAWHGSHDDLTAATEIAREIGDRRLEMAALRHLAGDVAIALSMPAGNYTGHLEAALRAAEAIGDRAVEADLCARTAVLSLNRLRFTEAIGQAQRAVAAARASGEEPALALALDGLKACYAYLGEAVQLAGVLDELDPLVRRQRETFLLCWTVFESAFVPLAAGDHVAADARMHLAVQLCRDSGWLSFEPWFLAHLGWSAWLRGDLTAAREYGHAAELLASEFGHGWWYPGALAIYGVILFDSDDRDGAVSRLERALPIAELASEAYLLRVLAPLALATGSADLLDRADGLLAGVDAPPGSAWILGADAYLCTARARLGQGRPERAAEVLAPLVAAARRVPWLPVRARLGPVLAQVRAATGLQRLD
jgi:DNA-binding SARP family transcriptional activator